MYTVGYRHHPPMHAYKHVYYYYPDVEVYWSPESETYSVYRDNGWVVVTTRPVFLTSGYSYIIIEDDGPDPWIRHNIYRGKYPPGKWNVKVKGKSKKKGWK